jgi:hypothetical protein
MVLRGDERSSRCQVAVVANGNITRRYHGGAETR